MSNIEPTVTRTMRCTSCSVVGVHTIAASMRNEAVLCPACAESGKRSTCVAVEPTAEQRAAAATLVFGETWPAFRSTAVARWVKAGVEDDGIDLCGADEIAQLLAEREAKLQARIDELQERLAKVRGESTNEKDIIIATMRRGADELITDNDTLRARVAELEAERGDTVGCEGCGKRLPSLCAVSTEDPVYLCARCVSPMHMEREAQHLADIKAGREALASVCIDILTSPAVTDTMWSHRSGLSTTNDYIASVLGIDTVDAYGKPTAELARLAHYDDAKAAEGGEG